jgi:uncharacterized protein (DUF1800 family)
MTNGRTAEAALALHRFGLGPTAASMERIVDDPRGALLAELDRSDGAHLAAADLPNSGQAARALYEFRAERAARQKVAQREKKEAETRRMAEGMPPDDNAMTVKDPPNAGAPVANAPIELPRQLFLNEARVRIDAALGADIGFVERLVWFWSNHFCISANKIVSMAGPYEREAIRPHVLGRFGDMLVAAESHPAMIFYLDNLESIGPKSVAGINLDKGLNENLAREILELHTLGVRSGYSQDDVTRFAMVLTGWTWLPLRGNPDHGGEFVFNKRMHEPGEQTVLGKSYPDAGVEQGRAVLADLARHPATARHIATKLARHFVADHPPPSLVERLEISFLESGGNLKYVARALVMSPEAWTPERTKLKRPSEWVAAALRLTGTRPALQRILGAEGQLGEPLWRPPAPNGFADEESAWVDGLARRLDIANEFAGTVAEGSDPLALLETAMPFASSETRQTIARAESRQQAIALLLMAPEFQRR